jgi:hypothetical protein
VCVSVPRVSPSVLLMLVVVVVVLLLLLPLLLLMAVPHGWACVPPPPPSEFNVVTNWASKEVAAVYRKDEATLEVVGDPGSVVPPHSLALLPSFLPSSPPFSCFLCWRGPRLSHSVVSVLRPRPLTHAHPHPQPQKFRLPTTFPLKRVQIICDRFVGVPPERWRRWELQITALFTQKVRWIRVPCFVTVLARLFTACRVQALHAVGLSALFFSFAWPQDGCLLDALVLWKQNLDKEFEGCEPCPICFAVISSTNHQLPRVSCGTCRNKYHGPCLQKWFRTSNKSVCPMCQQPMSVGH